MSTGSDHIIPGAIPVPGRGFLYLESSNQTVFEKTFDDMGDSIERADDQPAHGAMITENVAVRLPDGSSFFGLSFKGDIETWSRSIRRFAREHKIRVGEVKGGSFSVDGGPFFNLAECQIVFY